MSTLFRSLRECVYDLWYHRCIPGYEDLPRGLRCRVNLQALGLMLRSVDCFRLLAALVIWLLAGYCVVWQLDMHGSAAAWPVTTSMLWLYPRLAVLRRRYIHRALGGRWPLR